MLEKLPYRDMQATKIRAKLHNRAGYVVAGGKFAMINCGRRDAVTGIFW
jgi:hypothetical protein